MSLELAYSVFGEGPPLIVVHGLFGSKTNWRSFAKRLSSHYCVYTLDLRNHGDSPWAQTMTLEAMAQDIRDFIGHHDVHNATVLGHSLGGKAAMALALTHAPEVGALVVVDIAPVAYNPDFTDHIEAMRRLDLSAIATRGQADTALGARIPDATTRGLLLQNLVKRDRRFEWRLNLAALAESLSELMSFPAPLLARRYDGPTLFVHGGQSDYVQAAHRDRIEALFPHASIDSIANAGHWLHVEQADRLERRLHAFLGSDAVS